MGKRKEAAAEAGIGHNSDGSGEVAQDQIRSFVERIEKLEEEKKDIQGDIKDVYAEAKGQGFDTKALRALIARRKMDKDQLAHFDAMLDLYEGIFN